MPCAKFDKLVAMFVRAIIFALSVPFLSVFCPGQSSTAAELRDGHPFDTYAHKIKWRTETLLLDNLAYYLKRFPTNVAYIAYWIGDKNSPVKTRARAERARKYLVSIRQADGSRIIVTCAGTLDNSRTSIYMYKKGEPPPEFTDRSRCPK